MTSISASTVYNASGSRPLLIVCEHASNFVPEKLQQLGLTLDELSRHIAFDLGALDVAKGLAEAIDAPLVHSNISRLVIDLNRSPDDFDSIPQIGELTPVPGNIGLNQGDRDMRVHEYYQPFHSAVSDLIFKRRDLRAIVSVHSFTPVFKSGRRPWHLGIIHDEDVAFPLNTS